MISIYNLSRKKTAILRNFYKVSYEKPVNQIWSAGFYLPANDPARKKIEQLHYAEIKDKDGEYIGLFRIMNRTTTFNSTGKYIKYELSHVLSTLIDSAIEGYKQTGKAWTTTKVINWILSFQKVKNWQLGRCDFDRLFEYSFENQNGLADALFSVTEPFSEEFMWTYDTTSYPWTINLIKPDTKPVCRIREGWNLKDLSVEENPLKVVNKIYALGKGDGINNLNFKKINDGKNYVEDLQSQNDYGLIEYIWKDERFTNEESLLASATAMLDKFKRPIVTWTTTAIDLTKSIPSKSTIKIPSVDKLRSGQVVQLWTEMFGVVNLRIVNEKKSDMFGDPGNIDLEIGYIGETVATTLADLERKMEISKLSSVGATNKDTVTFAENCDENFPLKINFYCEEELKRINKILLTYQTEKYRAYSKATKGGGAIVSGGTTAGGGAYVSGSSTQSGGGTTVGSTSQSGGGSTQTSSANGSHRHLMFRMGSNAQAISSGLVYTAAQSSIGGSRGVVLSSKDGDPPGDLYTAEAADNHTHSVNIPAHTHNFSVTVPAHSHDFNINIPNHTHDFKIDIPDHTHEIDYGIWEDSKTPSKVEVKIDNKVVTTLTGTSADRFDIVEFLYNDDGLVTRGWHTIEIKPIGARARFVGQCTIYGFIGATDGGEF
ncbi:phage tail spike protein [uncultured Enterococcus sp.]|uniref:phage tail spike protein n=1 Tax=uncultured Enterococcus sp. TaxID=167972 RepID=UPI002587B62F|nr:phage tail spike protein [uncultured Enterococcus sp.]